MRGFTERLKKGRLALAALGVFAAMTGTAAMTTAAQAYDHGYYDRHDARWERDRRMEEERAREWRLHHYDWRYRYGAPAYYAPSYYVPPPVYYGEPRVGFGVTIR